MSLPIVSRPTNHPDAAQVLEAEHAGNNLNNLSVMPLARLRRLASGNAFVSQRPRRGLAVSQELTSRKRTRDANDNYLDKLLEGEHMTSLRGGACSLWVLGGRAFKEQRAFSPSDI